MNNRKRNMGIAMFTAISVLLSACSAGEGSTSAVMADRMKEESLRPGDKDFTFDYQLPEDWQPEIFPENNYEKIRDHLIKVDRARFPDGDEDNIRQIGEYYSNIDKRCAYAMIPPKGFWNKNPDMPQELYDLPVNGYCSKNDLRVVGGREFTELNKDLIPYYMEAAEHMFLSFYNLSRDSLDQTLEAGLYYSYPEGELEGTSIYQETKFYAENLPDWIRSEGAFLTDDSLCYLASDGSIRVRGIILYREEYENNKILCGKVCSDIIMGVIPEATKTQPWEWEFGDFYYQYHFDPIRPETITEDEYRKLVEQYKLTTGVLERPAWAGVYGGN